MEALRAERVRYREALRKQIEQTNKKRLFRDVMSEYEKKVNGLDLSAYENMDTSLHAKVIGVRDSSEPMHNSPSRTSVKSDVHPADGPPVAKTEKEEKEGYDYELVRKINIADVYPQKGNRAGRPSSILRASPSKLLEVAIQNMKDPTAGYMRHDTYNRAYGYKPTAFVPGKEQPPQINKSFDLSLAAKPQEFNRDCRGELNRSAIVENPLAVAGRAQLAPAVGERRAKAAGAMRRPAAKYNIITGVEAL